MKKISQWAAALLLLSTLNSQFSTAFAQGTAFTYQGQLQNNGGPASGSYNLTFALYTTNTTGVAIAGPVTNNAVSITNGLFTTMVDFGAGVFTGATNWLQIGVATNGVSSFTPLNPRQQLTPVPYAIFAGTAGNLSGTVASANLSGTYGGALNLTNAGNSFNGSYAGNGVNVTNVNAAALSGLNATNFWQLGGNDVSPSQFFGSTNDLPVRIRVNNLRALIILTNPADSASLIAGSPANAIDEGIEGAVIAGGGTTNFLGVSSSNHISANFDSIGGGSGNWIQSGSDHAVIGNGWNNLIATNSYQSVIGGGEYNAIANTYAVIGGGLSNTNSGSGSFLGAGQNNNVGANLAFIGGGYENSANAQYAVTVGGLNNVNSGQEAFIGDGQNNNATAALAVIGGGANNTNTSYVGTISGGQNNLSSGQYQSTVGGGYGNQATNSYATVPGGSQNIAGGVLSFAAGEMAQATNQGAFVWADSEGIPFGSTTANQFNVRANGGVRFVTSGAGMTLDGQPVLTNNQASPSFSGTVTAPSFQSDTHGDFVAGLGNLAVGGYATVGGGGTNEAGFYATVAGGGDNNASGTGAFIGGGGFDGSFFEGNTASGNASVIGGGMGNTASGGGAFVGGGGTDGFFYEGNQASGNASVIGGGLGNQATASYAVVPGGEINQIYSGADHATIGGGNHNQIYGYESTIGGGYFNLISAQDSVIAGGDLNAINTGANQSFIGGGVNNTNNSQLATVAGGNQNTANGPGAFIGGGGYDGTNYQGNTARGAASVIGGGLGNLNAGASYAVIAGGEFNTNNGLAGFIGSGLANAISNGVYYAVIAGGWDNSISNGASYAVIGGGVDNRNWGSESVIAGGDENTITVNGDTSVVAGGYDNTVSGEDAAVGGGIQNSATGKESVIAGGYNNTSSGSFESTVGGGGNNQATGENATVAGGGQNYATASYATVPGGQNNDAYGEWSFAAGQQAQAWYQGDFVWADSQSAAFTSTTNDQFLIRAQGGVGIGTSTTIAGGVTLATNMYLSGNALYLRGVDESGANQNDHNHGLAYCGPGETNFAPTVLPDGPVLWGFTGGVLGVMNGGAHAVLSWTNGGVSVAGLVYANGVLLTSDRNAKENFTPLDGKTVLAKVVALKVTEWNYKTDRSDVQHIGPMAQDFHAAFQVNGGDDTHISVVDEGGVALAAIQGLNQKLNEKDAEIQTLKAQNDSLADRLNVLEAALKTLVQNK